MKVWIYTILSVSIVSLISLIGVFSLALARDKLQKILLFLVSFAAGGLFGGAFIHLLPESFKNLSLGLSTSLYVISGILIFFTLEKFIRWRHCHVPVSETHLHPVVAMNLVGDGVHNLIDGMIIGASYLVSIPIGITTSVAVILHEIPQEIGDFGILLYGGLSVKKVLIYNFLSALAAVVGAFLSLFIGPEVKGYSTAMLPITAGGFIYIAGSDLVPELQCKCELSTSAKQFVSMVLGIGIMALLALLD
jgi:zinc and cadmium transporter